MRRCRGTLAPPELPRPEAAGFHDDEPIRETVRLADRCKHEWRLCSSGPAREPEQEDSGNPPALKKDEFAEVLVVRYQDTTLTLRKPQDSLLSSSPRFGLPHIEDVVTVAAQRRDDRRLDVLIRQESHSPSP